MKSRIFISMILIALTISCGQEVEMGQLDEAVDAEEFYKGDVSTFSSRMHYVNRTIQLRSADVSTTTGRSLATSNSQLNFYWQHIASVDAPVIQEMQLSATHFDVKNGVAYVSYHKQGDIHKGAVDIIDLSDPHYPRIVDQVVFPIADINALTSDFDGSVFMAASHEKRGAAVYKLRAAFNAFESDMQRYTLSNSLEGARSASANGVALTSDRAIVSSGKSHGGTFVLDKSTMRPLDVTPYADGKYVSTTQLGDLEYHVSLKTGEDAQLFVNDVTRSESELIQYDLPTIIHQNVEEIYKGKSTMEISKRNPQEVFVALGENGLRSYDILSGAEQSRSKGTMLVVGNTNGVTMDDEFLYIANGADGMSISTYPDEGTIDPLFYWDLPEQPASVNFTKAGGDFIFVAKGQGGFHILKRTPKAPYATVTTYDNVGVPENIVNFDVCSDLLPTIFSEALPERQNVMRNHPEYFEVETKNVEIVEDGKLYVTFLHEGAGYKNILGYYAYPSDNPPGSVEELEKLVIFPNASAQGSGGGLIRGNSVELLGEFEAGTTVGFFPYRQWMERENYRWLLHTIH